MRWLILLLVLVLLGAAAFGYINNASGCAKLAADLQADFPILATDLTAIFTSTTAPAASSPATDGTPAAPVAGTTVPAPASIIPAATPSLPANTLIQNGDFSQGTAHWEGDGRVAGAEALANPWMAKGLIVTLNPTSWTRIYQTFTAGPGTRFSIVVYYRLSPGISLSKNPADYTAINQLVQISGLERFEPLNSSLGQFFGTVGDPSASVAWEVYAPLLGSNRVQTYTHDYPAIPVSQTKTFGLAWPPGSGTVVILGTAVTAN